MINHSSLKITFLLLTLCLLLSFCALAQETPRILTLEESIEIGLKSSVDIQRYQELLKRDQEYVRAARANLKSNANINFDIPAFEQEIEGIKDIEGFTHYVYTTNTKWRSRLNINQPLPTNGNVSINYDFFYHIQKSWMNNYSNDFFLKFEQPIFTPNTLNMGIRRAEIGYERTDLEYTNRRLNLIYSITRDYLLLFEYIRQVNIYQRVVERLRNAYRASRKLFSEGKLEETDVLQLEIELSKARDEVLSTQSERDQNLNSFKQRIGLPPEDNVTIDTSMHYKTLKLPEDKILSEGLKRSTSVKLYEMDKEEYEMQKIDADRESEFKGSIVATYGLDKKDPLFDRSFSGFDKTQSLMMQFYLPLWDWGKNQAQVAAAEARIRSSEITIEENRKNVIRGLRDRIGELQNNIRRMEILSKSKEVATRNFTLTLRQFINNKIKSQELILTQNQLTETDEAYLDAYTDYQRTFADLLRRVSGAEPW